MLAAIFHSAAIQHAADEWTEKEHTSQKESKAATTEMTHAVWGDCCPKEISMADFARLVPPARKDSLFKMDNPSMYSAPCHSKGTNECSKPCSDWLFEKLFCKQGQVCWRSGQRLRKNECRELAAQSPTEKAFRFPTPDDASKFPEFPLVASRPNVGIAASGGGARAFASALGVFRALNQLKPEGSDKVMMDHVRYISGVSGGGWASTVFTYSQLSEVTDDQLTGTLGDWRPEKLTLTKLKERPAGSMAALPSGSKADIANVFKSFKEDQSGDKKNFWNLYIEDSYFKNHKIGKYPFTWNSTTEKAIKERNPQLEDTTFLKPRANKPYLILNTAMMGPANSDPISKIRSNCTFVNFEVGSAYSGTSVSFDSKELGWGGVEVGGYVESFALGTVTTKTDSTESTPIREKYFPENTLPWASGTGSTAYGIASQERVIETSLHVQSSANVFVPQLWYQPYGNQPASPNNRMAMMDSGNFENMGVMALLARKVEKLLVIVSTGDAIDQGTPTSGSSPCDFTALFGQLYTDVSNDCSLYRRNQVFPKTKLDTVYTALRDEQKKGNLPVTLQDLTTVENKEYGVPGGHQVQVLFMFLGRAENFKKLVPRKTQSPPWRERVYNWGKDPINWGKESSELNGTFWEEGTFPNYKTSSLERLISLPEEQVNMVAALMQWGVENNKDLFDQFFETVLI